MEEAILQTFLDLDVDDRIAKNYLDITLNRNINLKDRINHLHYIIQRISSFSPRQILRIMDYIIYAENELMKKERLTKFTLPPLQVCKDSDIIYSTTLISIYEWNIVRVIDSYCPSKFMLLDKIIGSLGNRKPKVNDLVEFMKEEIENVGFDNAHLELLLLLEFIVRLRKSGYYANLDRTYIRLVIDSNAPLEVQSKIRDEIVKDYMKNYGVDVKDLADGIFGMIFSINRFQEYVRNLQK